MGNSDSKADQPLLLSDIVLKSIQTIDINTPVYSLYVLNDKRIATCSEDGSVRILNPSKHYHIDETFNRHDIFPTTGLCQLDDGTIVTTACPIIQIGSHENLSAHGGDISKIIILPNDRIASSSNDATIKIWKSNPPYSDTPIKVLEGHTRIVNSIVYIKERDKLFSSSIDFTFILWNLKTYQCEAVFSGFEKCAYYNALYQIDKDRVIVGGKSMFSIINIDKCVVETTVKDEELGLVRCFLMLRDNRTILCGCGNGKMCFYNMMTQQHKITVDNHKKAINDLVSIDAHHLLSCSNDNTIKLWKY